MEGNEFNLTINTDASFSPKTKRGGYGIWIVYRDQRIKASGGFKDLLVDPMEAELKAVLNAFFIIDKWNVRVDRVIINCDNHGVRQYIDRKVDPINPKYKELESKLREYISKYPLVYSKRIKGHSSSSEPRHYVNNWCDKKAKEGRLEIEAKFNTQQKLNFGNNE